MTTTDNTKPRIVIWGLKKVYHTHRHIHQAFYKNAKKLGYETIWVEDEVKNQKLIRTGDLIITAEVHGKMVPIKNSLADYHLPVRDDVKYCFHNYKKLFTDQIDPKNFINLQVYNTSSESPEISDTKLDTARYFDTRTRTLFQPWGTDILYHEFRKPTFNTNKFVFWIGSIWNNAQNQGNINEINELKTVLHQRKLKFMQLRFIPDFMNTFFIRLSRIAPAISGRYQVEVNYLACRMFKNISYGQLGISNVKKFKDILGEDFVGTENSSVEEMVNISLDLKKESYIAQVKRQQEKIKNYTYKESLENIISFLK